MNFEKALKEMKENNKRMRLKGWLNYHYVYYDKAKDKVVTRMGNEISLENIKDRKDWQDYEEFQNKRLDDLNKEIKKIELSMNELVNEASCAEEEKRKLINDCKIYKTDFTDYKDSDVSEIKLIVERNGVINHEIWYGGYIDNNGHISVYTYSEISHYGIKWSDKLNSYIEYCSGCEDEEVKILGFYDLVINDCSDF